MRSFLSVTDLSPDEILATLDRAAKLKSGEPSDSLWGRVGVMIFEKPSLRTKLSFDVGINRLGGRAIYFNPDEVGIDTREPAADIARVISRMADFAIVRTYQHSLIEALDEAASIPVINALTDGEHPCQALADLLTIREACGGFQGVKVAFIGDGNNVAASLAFAMASVGGELVMASPHGYQLPADVVRKVGEIASGTGARISFVSDPQEAVEGANIVYTDVWASMGQEAETNIRKRDFSGFQVNPQLLELAAPGAKFMHDLPAHPGEEVSHGMIDIPQSIVFDQAENRLHAQAGLLDFIFDAG